MAAGSAPSPASLRPPGFSQRWCRAYRSSGAQVLVDGIATETALRVALDSGAELFSGPLLAPPALAGDVFPDAPLPIEALLAERRVIPLFR